MSGILSYLAVASELLQVTTGPFLWDVIFAAVYFEQVLLLNRKERKTTVNVLHVNNKILHGLSSHVCELIQKLPCYYSMCLVYVLLLTHGKKYIINWINSSVYLLRWSQCQCFNNVAKPRVTQTKSCPRALFNEMIRLTSCSFWLIFRLNQPHWLCLFSVWFDYRLISLWSHTNSF